MKRVVLATATLCVLTAASADALTLTPDEVSACYHDAVRFCGVTAADQDASLLRRAAIGACMIAHRAEVSLRCKAVFRAHGWSVQ